MISKGVKSSGKVSYFLALFPYAVLITLLIRALTLEGAWNGIKFFITPDFSKLLKPQVSSFFFADFFKCFSLLCSCTFSVLSPSHSGFMFILKKFINVKVWFSAITQIFFSLSVSMGPIIYYSSHNGFHHNIYRYKMHHFMAFIMLLLAHSGLK